MGRHHSETPFDNIESSHRYVSLLAEAIKETLAEVEDDIAMAGADQATKAVADHDGPVDLKLGACPRRVSRQGARRDSRRADRRHRRR